MGVFATNSIHHVDNQGNRGAAAQLEGGDRRGLSREEGGATGVRLLRFMHVVARASEERRSQEMAQR